MKPDPHTAALPLPEPQTSPLRAAFDRSGLIREGYTFDRAMAIRAIRIPLENSAHAMCVQARRQPRSPA